MFNIRFGGQNFEVLYDLIWFLVYSILVCSLYTVFDFRIHHTNHITFLPIFKAGEPLVIMNCRSIDNINVKIIKRKYLEIVFLCVQYLSYKSFILNKLKKGRIVVFVLQWQMTRCLWQHLLKYSVMVMQPCTNFVNVKKWATFIVFSLGIVWLSPVSCCMSH